MSTGAATNPVLPRLWLTRVHRAVDGEGHSLLALSIHWKREGKREQKRHSGDHVATSYANNRRPYNRNVARRVRSFHFIFIIPLTLRANPCIVGHL